MVEGEEGRGRQEANEEHNVEAAQQPEGVRGTVAKPMTSGENSGYRLISDLCGALVKSRGGPSLAWHRPAARVSPSPTRKRHLGFYKHLYAE